MMKLTLLLLGILSCLLQSSTVAFSVSTSGPSSTVQMSTTVAPPREKTDTDRQTRRGNDSDRSDDPDAGEISKYNDAPLEYLEDEWATRGPEDPFHILLLDTTFTKNERVTISYVSGCLTYVLGMPQEEATELTSMCAANGLSCLGTWEREECLRLGRQLQIRDLCVRVVPFCEGGARGWQAKDAAGSDGSIDVPYSSGFD
eukprot:CAMPEP_0204623832 /NCGR_PEP_ID=MMETSP0717-20131115/9598_1 /ASSEMBLY_ACC=CAM_ASM_000666 /TAXON_ID=230516 /ORGANISM="Chaetoceros curvisetus" /LENGTH=200 /DNA_ID=CAMNT_0051639039 /DNA_START=23 /DNA_END=625 /DNA_ORIENTATION=-